MQLQEVSKEVWRDNYKAPKEKKLSDTWERQAKAAASVENPSKKQQIYEDFLWLLTDFHGIAGGRITANLGVEGREATTLFNCYVHNPADIGYKDVDSIHGIYDMLKAQALTLKSEGGYGMNFSWIRPAGMYVSGIGARTPGVLAFMELWEISSKTITRGSEKIIDYIRDGEKKKIRKGAQMGILEIWHPEIEDFIEAKLTKGRLEKFNLSVGVTNGFMDAVIKDEMWELVFPDTKNEKYETEWNGNIDDWKSKKLPITIYHKVKARALWDKIMHSTYTRNEPGVIFLDLMNKLNPFAYGEHIATTNPCFSANERVLTNNGYYKFKDLLNVKNTELLTDNRITFRGTGKVENPQDWIINTEKTGVTGHTGSNSFLTKENAELVELTFDNGQKTKYTPDHHIATTAGMVEAIDLNKSHDILVSTPAPNFSISVVNKIPDKKDEIAAFLMGLISGDGTFDNVSVNIDLWGHDRKRMKNIICNLIEKLYNKYYHTVKFDKRWENRTLSKYYISESDNKTRISSTWLNHFLEQNYGFNKKTKFNVPEYVINKCRSNIGLYYLAGLYYADGTVSGTNEKGVSIRLSQSNEDFLREVQLICHANGITTKIFHRRDAHLTKFKGITYKCKSKYELITINSSYLDYYKLVGFFNDPVKNKKLNSLCKNKKRYHKNNYTKLVSRIRVENEDVYCIKEPVTRSIIVNTISNRRCGEVGMSTGVCNLMSLNLVRYIIKGDDGKYHFDYETFKKAIAIAVRFSDNINDISRVPLEEYRVSMVEKRRIGIGTLGLGSLHYILGIKFGSDESLKLITSIYCAKAETELLASAKLGKEKGSFIKFDKKKYYNSYWWKHLDIDKDIKKEIEEIGEMRNSHRSANAPTGNMSVYVGCVSSGIEPVFLHEYVRWVIVNDQEKSRLRESGFKFPDISKHEWFESGHLKIIKINNEEILEGTFEDVTYRVDKNRGLIKQNVVEDYGWRFAKQNFSEEYFKELNDKGVFVTTDDLSVDEHINTLEIIAKYTDMNSSKTINIPADYTFESFKHIYMKAWESGIKGVTSYRAGTMAGVLEKKQDISDKLESLEHTFIDAGDKVIFDKVKLPDVYYSMGYIIRDNNHKKWYVNIAFADKSLTRPFALFVNTNNKESNEVTDDAIHSLFKLAHDKGISKKSIDLQLEKYHGQSNVTKIARTIGFVLHHNIPVIAVVENLISCDFPFSSFSFHITRLLKQFIKDGAKVSGNAGICPECKSKTMVFQDGCIMCKDCNWSKCG